MPAAGRILRGSLCSFYDSDNYSVRSPAIVTVVINGQSTPWDIRQMSAHLSHTHTYTVPVEVVQNDRINFQTVVTVPKLLIL